MFGGFAIGAGLVFLFMPQGAAGAGRRWNDYINMGRRATDRLFGRRAEDLAGIPSVRPMPTRIMGHPGRPLIGRRMNGAISTPPPGRRETDIIASQTLVSFPEIDRRDGTGRRIADQE
jgi:hypothetical protein